MNKYEVQQRVLQNRKPLGLEKFNWDEKTKVFSTLECDLVIDFSDIDYCTFKTSHRCTFKTGSNCTFKTGSNCTFDTGWKCTFDTGSNCTFVTGYNCVIIRRDVFEIIQPEGGVKIKPNNHNVKGYTIVKDAKTITIDGKEIEISNESYEAFKKQFMEED